MHDLLPTARREVIARRLASGETVVASALAVEFDVSEDAIRRDLRALAAEGLCERVYGGALPLSPASAPILERLDEDAPRKRALAGAAAAMIQPGEMLFLDNGSTNLALARALPADHALTVATNSVPIAAVLFGRPDIRLVLIGGSVNAQVGGCIDADATAAARKLAIDRCFLGVCAISIARGAAAFDPADAVFKASLLAASERTAALVTTGKLETRAPFLFAPMGDLGALILEHDAPPEILLALAGLGVETLVAGPPA
jgi:DeoR/GlpR family transcriptional regulator of sugar metabolism